MKKKPAAKKSPARKAAPKRPVAKKILTKAEHAKAVREAAVLAKQLKTAQANFKDIQGKLRGLNKLQVQYTRQLKALNAGLKIMGDKEKALVKEIAALKKAHDSAKAATSRSAK
jgi:hypothetical protein